MNHLEIAQIKEIAIKLAYEIRGSSKLEDVIEDAKVIYQWISQP